jgi:hypothetical protein
MGARKRKRGERAKCKQLGGTYVKPATYQLAVELAEQDSIGVGLDRMAKLARAAVRKRKPLPNQSSTLTATVQ